MPPGDVVVRGEYEVGIQDQAFLGPESGLAVPDGEGGVDIYVATQWLHVDRDQVAPCLGLPPEQVRIHLAGVGGAFGGREDLSMQIHGALLALHTGRAVRIVYGRAESFVGHVHRHPARMRFEHRATRDGRITCVHCEILLDGGAYASSSAAVVSNACAFALGPYAVPNALIEGTVVYTNNPPCGAMRGFGAVQTCFGSEAQMDLLAAELGMDPVELRLRNAMAPGDVLPTGQRITGSLPVAEVIRRAAALPLPEPEPTPRDPRRLPGGMGDTTRGEGVRRGVGFAVGYKNICFSEGFDDFCAARVVLRADGGAVVHCAAAEVGQGVGSVLLQVARTRAGTEDVTLAPHTTTTVGSAGSASASRMTWMATGAVRDACRAALAERSERGARGRRRAHPPPPAHDAARPRDRPDHGRARARRVRGLRDARRRRGRRGSRPRARRLDRRRPGHRPRPQPPGRDRPDRGRHRAGHRPRADGGDPHARRPHRQPDVHRLPAADRARHAAARHRAGRGSGAGSALRRQGRGRASDGRLDGRGRRRAARRAADGRSRGCPCGPTTSRSAESPAHLFLCDVDAHASTTTSPGTTTRSMSTGRLGARRRARCSTRSSAASSATRRTRVLDCSCGIGTQAIGLALRGHDVLATDLSPGVVERAGARRRRWARRSRPASPTSRGSPSRSRDVRLRAPCDNSVAHLHSDETGALRRGRRRRAAPGGLALVSLRDYAPLVAERAAGHPVRVGPGTISFQVWDWDDDGRGYELAQFTLRGEGEMADVLPPHAAARAAARRPLRRARGRRARRRALAHAGGDGLLPAGGDCAAALRRAATVRGMRFSPLADRLARDDTQAWNVHRLASERRARGDDIIMLTIGDPDFETPPVVVEAAYASMRAGRTHYAYSQGDRRCGGDRQARVDVGRAAGDASASCSSRARRPRCSPSASACSAGRRGHRPRAVLRDLSRIFAAAGATTVNVPLRPERGFQLDVAEVEAALTERTRAIVLTTPHNPTGACVPAETLAALGELCREHDLWLVSDEVYGSLLFGGRRHASVLAVDGAEERIAGISSLSKSHAMTGWRTGWAVVPEELKTRLVLLLDCMLFGSPPFISDAATTALREADAATAEMRAAYESRAAVVARIDGEAGLRCHMPMGGMFIMLDVRAWASPPPSSRSGCSRARASRYSRSRPSARAARPRPPRLPPTRTSSPRAAAASRASRRACGAAPPRGRSASGA